MIRVPMPQLYLQCFHTELFPLLHTSGLLSPYHKATWFSLHVLHLDCHRTAGIKHVVQERNAAMLWRPAKCICLLVCPCLLFRIQIHHYNSLCNRPEIKIIIFGNFVNVLLWYLRWKGNMERLHTAEVRQRFGIILIELFNFLCIKCLVGYPINE